MRKNLFFISALSLFFSTGALAQSLKFDGSIFCHRGGNGKIIADFKENILEIDQLLSPAQLGQARAQMNFFVRDASLARHRSSFTLGAVGMEEIKNVQLTSDYFQVDGEQVLASARLSIKNIDSLIQGDSSSKARGELQIWLGEFVGFEPGVSGGPVPKYHWSFYSSEAVSCQVGR